MHKYLLGNTYSKYIIILFLQPADEGTSLWRSLATLVKGEINDIL